MDCSKFEYSNHCLLRIIERDIAVDDIEIAARNGQIIKEYLDDKPYPSFLILGFVNKKALHVVVAYFQKKCIVITAYWADETKWEENFKSKK